MAISKAKKEPLLSSSRSTTRHITYLRRPPGASAPAYAASAVKSTSLGHPAHHPKRMEQVQEHFRSNAGAA